MLTDIGLMPFLHQKLKFPSSSVALDVAVVLLSGFLGKQCAIKAGLPLWWRRDDKLSIEKQLISLFAFGVMVILPNTLISLYYANDETVPWLHFSNVNETVLLALRAALQEEIVFRLFLFSLSVLVAGRLVNSRKLVIIIGMVLSTFLFAAMHSGYVMAFASGLILAHIFCCSGLLPAMAVHFLADAIPWLLVCFACS